MIIGIAELFGMMTLLGSLRVPLGDTVDLFIPDAFLLASGWMSVF